MKLMRKVPIVLMTAAALTVTACAQSERESGNEATGAAGGDLKDTLTFGAAGAPKLFDPFYATDGETFRVTRQMFEGLVGIKAGSAEIEPELAEKWEPDASGTNWTFTLREGVKFTDGEPFNADAVCQNFERMFDQNDAGQVRGEQLLLAADEEPAVEPAGLPEGRAADHRGTGQEAQERVARQARFGGQRAILQLEADGGLPLSQHCHKVG